MKIPVVLIIYKRSNNLKKLISAVREYKPSKIYLVADGPKNKTDAKSCKKTRETTEELIDWKCKINKIYARKNMGLRNRVVSGLDKVFSDEKWAIILEDDLVIEPSFFSYCDTLLKKYEKNKRIISIAGNNFQFGKNKIKESYYFSRYVHSWGWATWRRAWQLYDNEMKDWQDLKKTNWLKNIFNNKVLELYWKKIFNMVMDKEVDSWAYRWTYTSLLNNKLTIIPKVNLVSNNGYGKNATHTKLKSRTLDLPIEEINSPLKHPKKIKRNKQADKTTERNTYLTPIMVISLLFRSALQLIGNKKNE
jgi:hypothetical protein